MSIRIRGACRLVFGDVRIPGGLCPTGIPLRGLARVTQARFGWRLLRVATPASSPGPLPAAVRGAQRTTLTDIALACALPTPAAIEIPTLPLAPASAPDIMRALLAELVLS